MVATKIQNETYKSVSELEEDLQKMCKNAMQFNEPGSVIYKDAKNIAKLVKSKKLEIEANKVARENRGARTTRRQQGKKHYSEEVSYWILFTVKDNVNSNILYSDIRIDL